ncbi:sulfite exporter TauE/SafE family protein [Zunongwangia sp.]|uniref:sulfite exporter TauE/SafE family protein n=1 Tax=Zunongwangia sp. TaxID=1965325 RepID=UPI003AA98B5D
MLVSALLLGLLGSFHCVGMCGPIAFLLPLNRANKWLMYFQLFLYHLGRIISYAFIGLLFGLLGRGLHLFAAQQKLSIGIGVFMVLIVLLSFGTKKFQKLGSPFYRIISKIKSKIGANLKKQTPDTFLSIGLLNGFLPCGLVYMGVLGAIAQANAAYGSLYMVFFGFGTIPLMTITVALGNWIGVNTRNKIRKFIPVFVMLTGILFILRGAGLGIPYVSPKVSDDKVNATIECHQPLSLQENE